VDIVEAHTSPLWTSVGPGASCHTRWSPDVAKPIAFRGGDFFTDPLPEADVLVFGHVLHNWGEQDRIRLLRNAYAAVHPGGAVLIYDLMIGDDMPPMNAVLTSMRGAAVGGCGGCDIAGR
jgi:hypothetical protein